MHIIFEDQFLLAICKPAGLSTESGTHKHPSAETEAMSYYKDSLQKNATAKQQKPTPYLRSVHRLDRASSGVLVFAKTKAALTYLMGQFERRETEKTYRAIVEKAPVPTCGTLEHFLKKSEDGRKAIVSDTQLHGSQPCALSYTLLKMMGEQAELEIRPVTGRFHQIRAQLAHIGCPVVGDVAYGAKPLKEHEVMLHAERLKVVHPATGEVLVLEVGPAWEK